MTSNQIAYWSLQEQIRSNKENEDVRRETFKETQRANLINEKLKERDVESQVTRRTFQNVNDTAGTLIKGVDTAAKILPRATGNFANYYPLLSKI